MAGGYHGSVPPGWADRQLVPLTCDICGPVHDADLRRLSGPAGDIQICEPCIERLLDATPRQ